MAEGASGADDVASVAVRRRVPGDLVPRAELRSYRDGTDADIRDLSAECAAWGIDRVADPKLFRLGANDWMTFNTGSPAGANDLYIRPLEPSDAPPIRCEFDERAPIEKNWQFVERDGRLVAVYSIDPLVLLAASMPRPGDASVAFRCIHGVPAADIRTGWRRRMPHRSLSIGTPLLSVDGDRHRMIVHEKFHVAGRRLYVGRAAELDLGGTPMLTLGRRRLVWSWWTLLGTWPQLNPNLVSCTYFSGIAGDPDAPVLSIGINDARGEVVRCRWEDLV